MNIVFFHFHPIGLLYRVMHNIPIFKSKSMKFGKHMPWGHGGLVVNTSDSGSRGRGFESHSSRRVVSMSKTYLPPKGTGYTQEAVVPSQRD